MLKREITPSSPGREVYGDSFCQDASYANWRPHGSGDCLLIYTEAGAGRIASAAGRCATRAGEVILYAPGQAQDYATDPDVGKWHLLWAHFHPKTDLPPGRGWPLNAAGVRCLHLADETVRAPFRESLLRMNQMLRQALPHRIDLAHNALEAALLWAGVALAQRGEPAPDARVTKACDHLSASLQAPFDLPALARHSGLSVSRLSFLFKKQTDLSPQQFLERARMHRACQLLRRTSLSVAQVAEETGYADPFYFSNRFRRFVKKSPSAYRRQGADEQVGDDARPRSLPA